VHSLHVLLKRLDNVDTTVNLLSVQIAAIGCAASKIEKWLASRGSVPYSIEHPELALSLQACATLITRIREHLANTEKKRDRRTFVAKAKFIWSEDEVRAYREALQSQVQVLQLHLTVLQL
jgi:hypothetical protein